MCAAEIIGDINKVHGKNVVKIRKPSRYWFPRFRNGNPRIKRTLSERSAGFDNEVSQPLIETHSSPMCEEIAKKSSSSAATVFHEFERKTGGIREKRGCWLRVQKIISRIDAIALQYERSLTGSETRPNYDRKIEERSFSLKINAREVIMTNNIGDWIQFLSELAIFVWCCKWSLICTELTKLK